MLKKKLLSSLLSVAMLLSLVAVNVSASNTDAISEVIVDASGYTQYAHSWNRVTQGSQVNTTGTTTVSGIGDDPNHCVRFKVNPTEGTNTGVGKVSRFATSKCINPMQSDSDSETVKPADATKPMFWSVDVWSGSDVDYVQMTLQGAAMSPQLAMSDLVANDWNTLSVVFYPAAYLGTEKGTADFYLNGEYVQSYTNLSATATEYRLLFMFNAADEYFYIDNLKLYEMTSFTRPSVDTSKVTVSGNVITNYVTETRDASAFQITSYDATVAAVEALLGGIIYEADGVTEASDTSNIQAGMKIKAPSNTIENVGTFTDDNVYTFSNVAETYLDASTLTNWANGWNRVMQQGNRITPSSGSSGITTQDGNTFAAYKFSGTDLTQRTGFSIAECYWKDSSSTASTAVPANIATTPIYASVDVYDNDAITSIHWETEAGHDMSIPVAKEDLISNDWNTFALVYYPNTADNTKLGYADSYINGKLMSTIDLSNYLVNNEGSKIQFMFQYTAFDTAAYFDNHKVMALTSFAAPALKSGTATVTNGLIKGYTSATVAALETELGANVVAANGTEVDGAIAPAAGMKAIVTSTVEGAGTFTAEYVLGADEYTVGNWATADGSAIGSTLPAGELVAKLPVENLTGATASFTVLIAEYTGDKLVNVYSAPATITDISGNAEITYTLKAGNTYKLFAWESINNLKPIIPAKEFTVQ